VNEATSGNTTKLNILFASPLQWSDFIITSFLMYSLYSETPLNWTLIKLALPEYRPIFPAEHFFAKEVS
jgi:hypothetical protein